METETSMETARRMMEAAYQAQEDGQIESAIDLYQASINIYPTAEAHTFLGWAYSKLGRFEDAIAECMTAIQIDPEYGNPYNDIGAYLMELDRWEESLEWLTKASQAARYEHRAFPYMNMARAYRHLGQDIEALKALKGAWQADPSHLPALHAYEHLLGRLN